MSVVSRIRIVSAIAGSTALAVLFFAVLWAGSSLGVFSGLRSLWPAGALLLGLPLLTTVCVGLALSVDVRHRRA